MKNGSGSGMQPMVWFPRPRQLGQLIRTARTRRGLSLFQVGMAIAMDPSNLARIERGQRSVSWDVLGQLGLVLGDPDILAAAEQALRDLLDGPEAA